MAIEQKKILINCLHNFEKNFKEENIERRYEYDVNNNDSTQSTGILLLLFFLVDLRPRHVCSFPATY